MDLDRLSKICGMLGSSHPGERAVAAAKATALLQDAGMTWDAFVRSRTETPSRAELVRKHHADLAQMLLDQFFPSPFINEKTAAFLQEVSGKYACRRLSAKQERWLNAIAQKCLQSEKERTAAA